MNESTCVQKPQTYKKSHLYWMITFQIYILALVQLTFVSCTRKPSNSLANYCPATLEKVRDNCGCEPKIEALGNVLNKLNLPDEEVLSLKHCVEGKVNLTAMGVNLTQSDINSCITTKDVKLDTSTRNRIFTEFEIARKLDSNQVIIWYKCYDHVMAGDGKSSNSN